MEEVNNAGNTENTENAVAAEGTQETNSIPDKNESGNTENTESKDVEPEASEPEAVEWFMKDKFKTEQDQAKAYPELLKKMGKYWGAPKEGEYKLPDDFEGVTKDDPLLQHLSPELKELGLSNDGFTKLVSSYQSATQKMAEEMTHKVQKELTDNDAQTVQNVDKWLTDNFEESEKEVIQSWIMSVDDFKTLNKLRAMMPTKSAVPSSSGQYAARFETAKDIESEKIQNFEKFTKDQNYRNTINQRYRDALLRESKK